MARVDIAALALRLAGLYAWMHALVLLPILGVYLGSTSGFDPSGGMMVSTSVAIGLIAVLGSVLYIGAPRLARRLFPERELVAADPVDMGSIAFCVAGILFLDGGFRMSASIGAAAEFMTSIRGTTPLAVAIGVCVTLLAMGAWLIVDRQRLSRRLFGAVGGEEVASLAPVAIALVGLWILADSLPAFLGPVGTSLWRSLSDTELPIAWRSGDWIAAGRVGLGLFLVIGSRKMLAAWLARQAPKPVVPGV